MYFFQVKLHIELLLNSSGKTKYKQQQTTQVIPSKTQSCELQNKSLSHAFSRHNPNTAISHAVGQ